MKKKYLNCNSKTIEFTKNKLRSFNSKKMKIFAMNQNNLRAGINNVFKS